MASTDRTWFIVEQLVGSSVWTSRIGALAGCASASPLRMREVFASDARDVLVFAQDRVLVVEPLPGDRIGPAATRRAAKGDPSGLGRVRAVAKADVETFSIIPISPGVLNAGGGLATAIVKVRPGVPGGDIHFVVDTDVTPLRGTVADVNTWLAQRGPTARDAIAPPGRPTTGRLRRLLAAGSILAVAAVAALVVSTLATDDGPAADASAGHEVPDVVGQRLETALRGIPAQLVTRQVDSYSDVLPAGYVCAVDPTPGSLLAPGSTVTLSVTLGPFPVHVPDVVGQPLAAAEKLLEDAGLTDVRVDREDSDEPPDTVLRQTPAAGTGLETAGGQEVALVVSDGPDL